MKMFVWTFVLVFSGGLFVQGADIYRANARNTPDETPEAALEQDMIESQTSEDGTQLEHDLEEIRKQPIGNIQPEETADNANSGPKFQFADPGKDALDIQLLYDLIRAVEYEANFQLFDKVLKDFDKANYPIPEEAQRLRNSGKPLTRDVAQEKDVDNLLPVIDSLALESPIDGVGDAPDDDGSSVDEKGTVTAEERPINLKVPLHERIATVLRDVPMMKTPVAMEDGAKGAISKEKLQF